MSDLVAVASRTRKGAEAFADAHEVPRGYGDYDAFLADDAVDVVYVCTPIGTHAEHARRALEAGKHVVRRPSFAPRAWLAAPDGPPAGSLSLAVLSRPASGRCAQGVLLFPNRDFWEAAFLWTSPKDRFLGGCARIRTLDRLLKSWLLRLNGDEPGSLGLAGSRAPGPHATS